VTIVIPAPGTWNCNVRYTQTNTME